MAWLNHEFTLRQVRQENTKIKKISLLITLFLMIQICYRISATIAQENEETPQIRNVIEAYLTAFCNRDINSIIQTISTNYYSKKGDEVIDYAKFKSTREKQFNDAANNSGLYVDKSISNLKILKSYFQDNNATVEVEFEIMAYNIGTLEKQGKIVAEAFSLAKEGDAWKITRVKRTGLSNWLSLEQLKVINNGSRVN